MTKLRDEFAHALLERRLTDGFVTVEFREGHTFGSRGPQVVKLTEPLHDGSATRLIEAVENLAKRIINSTGKQRAFIVTTPLTFSSVDIKITVIEFQGTS